MAVFRAFIAVDLSSEIQQCLSQVVDDFKKALGENAPVRWVPVENIHLTLKFLGDVSVANVEMLTEIVRSVAENHHVFEISVGGNGAFPNTRRPRVLWVGIEAPSELIMVQRNIDIETSRLGYASDKRGFSPHLTMGRISRNASTRDLREISKFLDKKTVGFLGVTSINEIHLFRSDLHPGGAVYSKVFSAKLQENYA